MVSGSEHWRVPTVTLGVLGQTQLQELCVEGSVFLPSGFEFTSKSSRNASLVCVLPHFRVSTKARKSHEVSLTLATDVGLRLQKVRTYLQVRELTLVCAPDVTVQTC